VVTKNELSLIYPSAGGDEATYVSENRRSKDYSLMRLTRRLSQTLGKAGAVQGACGGRRERESEKVERQGIPLPPEK
jgi:hypothetical protein